jgi:hypothetical protein
VHRFARLAASALHQAEVGAAKTMIDRTIDQLDVRPFRLAADADYDSAEMLGWLGGAQRSLTTPLLQLDPSAISRVLERRILRLNREGFR